MIEHAISTSSHNKIIAGVIFIVYCQSGYLCGNYLHVLDFGFLFSVAEKPINHHTTSYYSNLFLFFPLLALCLLHIINHISPSVVL